MVRKTKLTQWSANPHLEFENALWENGILTIAGIDEAGRGALAGPVVAAAVILPIIKGLSAKLIGVRDSKLMSPTDRSKWAEEIKVIAASWSIGSASAKEIDHIGILDATRLASIRAIERLGMCPECLLLDYIEIPNIHLAQVSLTKGDRVSLSIAAASILAKTNRDAMLCELDIQFPGYGFSRHKGYGTREHLQALDEIGPSPFHRYSFAPLRYFN